MNINATRVRPGLRNLRDLGGLVAKAGITRSSALMRSDALDYATAEDLTHLRDGLGLVIDLREEREVTGEPPPDGQEPLPTVRLPIVTARGMPADDGGGTMLARLYVQYFEESEDRIVAAVEQIAQRAGQRAVLVHCAQGKDRTGLLIALVLALAGVQRSAIVADYVATQANIAALVRHQRADPRYRKRIERFPPEVHRADATTIESFLDEIDRRFGGVRAWALEAGMTVEMLDELVRVLVEASR